MPAAHQDQLVCRSSYTDNAAELHEDRQPVNKSASHAGNLYDWIMWQIQAHRPDEISLCIEHNWPMHAGAVGSSLNVKEAFQFKGSPGGHATRAMRMHAIQSSLVVIALAMRIMAATPGKRILRLSSLLVQLFLLNLQLHSTCHTKPS